MCRGILGDSSDCNNIAHGIFLLQVTRCLQLVHRQNIETSAEIFFLQAWSKESLLFDLYLQIKIHLFVRKKSQNAGVNWAKKAYQCIVYTPMRSPIASNRRVYLSLSSTNILKTTQIHVFAQLRSCQWLFAFLKLDEDLLLNVQTSFVYPLR